MTFILIIKAITVGATGEDDQRAWHSNFGKCTDIFAPALGVISADNTAQNASTTFGGTSAACPYVSGMLNGHFHCNMLQYYVDIQRKCR